MTSARLKPVTDNSWILHDNGTRLAMIIKTADGYSAIGQLDRKQFNDLDDLEQFLGGKLAVDEPEEEKEAEAGDVEGYPIKHSTSHDIKTDAYPSYSKVQGSSIRFAAGYYGVLFAHGWVYSYCPKTTTLEENQWIGPFRTRLEMQNAITQKKNAPRV